MTASGGASQSGSSATRAVGRTAATLMTAGMIIGTGIFGALGATAERAGPALLLAMIPGGLVCLATGISGAQLGVNFPRHGGAFACGARDGRGARIAEVVRQGLSAFEGAASRSTCRRGARLCSGAGVRPASGLAARQLLPAGLVCHYPLRGSALK
ncbi:hypothetical protein [Mesorhizobium sp. M0923]|uniref:hypothetical protein n=1 Tax=Mesorhizobium sp. M0923 TaxID=2957028 RepID=UPI0012EB6314